MRWFFHRKRNKKYQIVLQELKKTFEGQKGWDFLMELSLKDKESMTRQELQVVFQFKKLVLHLSASKHNKRIQYQRCTKSLRRVIELSKFLSFKEKWHEKMQSLLLELCSARYYRTHFYAFGRQLLEELFFSLSFSGSNQSSKEHFSNFDFLEESHLIENSGPLIFLERDFRKFDEFTLKRKFDSHSYNLPSLLYTIAFFGEKGIKRIKMVRMGSPTRESWFEKPRIIEEFQGFLTHLQRQGKRHLYVNKQKTWGEEGRRSEKIKELELSNEHFFCVCLPSDGDFYHQSGRFENVNQMEVFKPLFSKMLREKINFGYYHLPKCWREDPEFCKGLRRVIDEVHALYFESKEELNPKERQLFIDLSYTHLILYFLKYSEVDSVNITCRDGIDRAGCEQSKLLYYFQISLGIEEETVAHEELQFLLHVPVYLAKSRPIVPERREFLYKVFESFTPTVKEEIRRKHQECPLLHSKPHFVKRNYLNK